MYLRRISFGLYVLHTLAVEVVFDFFPPISFYHVSVGLSKICLAFGLTVLMALLSYKYLETPFLKMKKRHAVIESHPV